MGLSIKKAGMKRQRSIFWELETDCDPAVSWASAVLALSRGAIGWRDTSYALTALRQAKPAERLDGPASRQPSHTTKLRRASAEGLE